MLPGLLTYASDGRDYCGEFGRKGIEMKCLMRSAAPAIASHLLSNVCLLFISFSYDGQLWVSIERAATTPGIRLARARGSRLV